MFIPEAITNTSARIGCVVMASGCGSRFSDAPGEKLVTPLSGVPVLERTLAPLLACGLTPVVVTRWLAVEALCAKLDVHCLMHTRPEHSATVRAGINAVGLVDACLFMPGDQPFLSQQSLCMLLHEFALQKDHRGYAPVVRLSWHGVPGSPMLFPKRLFGELRALKGDVGGSEVLRRRSDLSGPVALVEANLALELRDIDTRAQLVELETQACSAGLLS